MLAVLIAACGGTNNDTTGSTSTGSASTPNNVVHMNDTNFVQKTVTIKKGDSLTLVDDVATVHIIQNGTWESNGTPKAGKEPGAPTVQVQFQGNDSQTIGPFNTAGTFQLYCTVHSGMNLTVIVQ